MEHDMTIKERFGFTEKEMEIIRHRLEVPDCVIPCVTEMGFHAEDVEDVFSILSGKEDWTEAAAHSERISFEVIHDCLDGSTWCADLDGFQEISRQRAASNRKIYLSACDKFESHYDRRIERKLA